MYWLKFHASGCQKYFFDLVKGEVGEYRIAGNWRDKKTFANFAVIRELFLANFSCTIIILKIAVYGYV